MRREWNKEDKGEVRDGFGKGSREKKTTDREKKNTNLTRKVTKEVVHVPSPSTVACCFHSLPVLCLLNLLRSYS